jgi:uncharacterized protein YcbK (DUF882 family)
MGSRVIVSAQRARARVAAISRRIRSRFRARWLTPAVFGAAALAAIEFIHAPQAPRAPFAALTRVQSAWPSPDAFGKSGEVKVRFALPGREVEFPIAVSRDPSVLAYQWVSLDDTVAVDSTRPLSAGGSTVVAPRQAGFFRLVILRRGAEGEPAVVKETMTAPTLAVMVPFEQKRGGVLNGYRIGTYLAERLRNGNHEEPMGFLEVESAEQDLFVSKHFRLADFLTHDAQQDVWPKYVALNPRLLDKLELVMTELERMRGIGTDEDLALGVHSGFRTPSHNAQVGAAASDSRHQYGDAADVVIDADGDGRVTRKDASLVATAVDSVEGAHPELVGGLGLYTSGRYSTPYVHIDARGKPSRWRG